MKECLIREFAVISPKLVEERHYFLEWMQTPICIWTIRIVLLAIGMTALGIYIMMKRKSGK